MKLLFAGEHYPCTKAVRRETTAWIFLESGEVLHLSGVHDWSALVLEDGTWSQPEVTPQEQLRADVDFLAAMTGVMLA